MGCSSNGDPETVVYNNGRLYFGGLLLFTAYWLRHYFDFIPLLLKKICPDNSVK